MRQMLIILGTIFLIIIIVVTAAITFVAVREAALDKESKAYVDKTVPLIVSRWDEQELLKRASPEFMQAAPTNELDKFFVMARRLGKLREYQGSEGQSYISVTTQNGKTITAKYSVNAVFDADPAVINIVLIKHGDQWQIEGFHVDSDLFLQH